MKRMPVWCLKGSQIFRLGSTLSWVVATWHLLNTRDAVLCCYYRATPSGLPVPVLYFKEPVNGIEVLDSVGIIRLLVNLEIKVN